ncbi:DUF4181 domain-containing protein [Cytobacillus dafuensis]|uniref:DUF4181 domain-containing protein n=1 Tax=Cytobacillus dafuensis TaxID=1742359 RepID=A0A5B8Z152_CYTDA|nr:DUF4181 domain-containing protein [Cytobacillus dafuensis]QED46467.1 DUF4181 domain-containing protein [Cytobacillus dafuensis]
MGAIPSFICLILVFFHWILRIIITGNIKEELPENAKDFDLYGKIILALIGIITIIIFIVVNEVEGDVIKWFWMIFIILALGFQSFIDWKYLKDSRRYIVSIIVLIIGVGLVNILL